MALPLPKLTRRLFAWRDRVNLCVRRKTHKFSLRAEHYGFIAVAAVDAFHWHSLLFLVSIWLLITGIVAEFFYTGE